MSSLKPYQQELVDHILDKLSYDNRAKGLMQTAPFPSSLYLDNLNLPIFADMGTGKTPTTIRLLQEIRKVLPSNLRLLPSLIICPASVKYNWYHEFRRWAPEIPDSMLLLIDGEGGQREEQLAYLKQVQPYYAIINYDLVRIHRSFFQNEMDFLCVVCDEAHAIKNRRAQRTTAVKAIRSKFRIALTGTPITNRPNDLWSIVDWLWPGKEYYRTVAGKSRRYHQSGVWGSHDSFVGRYCKENPRTKRILGGVNLLSLHRALEGAGMVRWRKQEVLDLEPIIYKYMILTPTEAQKALYEQLRRGFAQMVTPPGELSYRQVHGFFAQLIHLRRATTLTPREFSLALGGHNPRFAPDLQIPISDRGGKTDWLFNFIEGYLNDDKLLVFCEWTSATRPLLRRLEKKGIGAVGIEGATSQRERFDIQERFNRDPLLKVFVGSPAAYEGLNLQAANYVVFLNLPWRPKDIFHAYARAHRLGQTQQVTVVFLCLANTIDERIAEVLQEKQEDIDKALDAGRANLAQLFKIKRGGDFLRLI